MNITPFKENDVDDDSEDGPEEMGDFMEVWKLKLKICDLNSFIILLTKKLTNYLFHTVKKTNIFYKHCKRISFSERLSIFPLT